MLSKRLDPITIVFHHFNACSHTVVQRGLLCWFWLFYAFCTGPISLNFGMKLQKMNMNLISKTSFFFCCTFVNVCHVQLKAKMDHTSLWLRNADVLTFRFWYYDCHIRDTNGIFAMSFNAFFGLSRISNHMHIFKRTWLVSLSKEVNNNH